jgi:hypothetical protein
VAPEVSEGVGEVLEFIGDNAAAFWTWLLVQSKDHPVLLAVVAVFLVFALWCRRRRE